MKAHLYSFVVTFSLGAILLNELPANKRVRRAMAVCVATGDEIRERIDAADEDMQHAMIITSRKHLRRVRDLLLEYPIVTDMAKAKGEWVASAKQLIKDTEEVRA
jgi:hypothetical protein